ncbi:GFA family protein [Pelagerythrobacter sp.]|uniref:GFA family protein n=1 Tax=Pelagerythrobacter sp. TaxID=2800702 RepID=UPI0035B41AEC
MTRPSLPADGGCRCGQLRFRISAEPLLTGACHCTGCQRMTGGAYSLTVTVPESGFTVTKGEPAIGGLHGEVRHFHCPYCMSWVFTRPPQGTMPFVNVRATMLDDASWFVPFVESFTSEKLPWATTPAERSYPEFPPMEDYEEMIAAFAKAQTA